MVNVILNIYTLVPALFGPRWCKDDSILVWSTMTRAKGARLDQSSSHIGKYTLVAHISIGIYFLSENTIFTSWEKLF